MVADVLRGVTWDDAERAMSIDWFAFTTRRPMSQILSLFDGRLEQPLVFAEKGFHGYQCSFVSVSGVTVLFTSGRDDIHVQVSGTGCKVFGFFGLLMLLVDDDKVTRCDVALDCIGSGVTCEDVWGCLQQGQYVSVSSSFRKVEGLLREGESGRQPYTIYVGSGQSDRMLRVYDKGVESGTGADWLRFEMQLRRGSADEFVRLIRRAQDAPPCFRHFGLTSEDAFRYAGLGILNRQLRLVDRAKGKHREKDVVLPFWAWLTDSVGLFALRVPVSSKKFCNLMRYVKNAGAAIKTLQLAMPDFPCFISDVVGASALKPHHLQLIDEALLPGDMLTEVAYMEVFPVENA